MTENMIFRSKAKTTWCLGTIIGRIMGLLHSDVQLITCYCPLPVLGHWKCCLLFKCVRKMYIYIYLGNRVVTLKAYDISSLSTLTWMQCISPQALHPDRVNHNHVRDMIIQLPSTLSVLEERHISLIVRLLVLPETWEFHAYNRNLRESSILDVKCSVKIYLVEYVLQVTENDTGHVMSREEKR